MASARKIGEMIATFKASYSLFARDTNVDVLAKTWLAVFKDVPDEMLNVATIKVLQTLKTPPTPADVLEQVREIATANAPTNEEMWVALTKAVRKSQEHIYNFGHTLIEDNGKTQGENARDKFQRLWDELPKELKDYLGGKGELMRLAKYNDEEMMFEKKTFLKMMPTINKRQEYSELSLLASGSNNNLLEQKNG